MKVLFLAVFLSLSFSFNSFASEPSVDKMALSSEIINAEIEIQSFMSSLPKWILDNAYEANRETLRNFAMYMVYIEGIRLSVRLVYMKVILLEMLLDDSRATIIEQEITNVKDKIAKLEKEVDEMAKADESGIYDSFKPLNGQTFYEMFQTKFIPSWKKSLEELTASIK